MTLKGHKQTKNIRPKLKPAPDGTKPPSSKLMDWALIEKQIEQGIPKIHIAASLGLSQAAFQNRISRRVTLSNIVPIKENKQALDKFKKDRADILADKQRQILDAVTDEKIEKATAYQLTGMFSLLYDKERLERGMSTDNVTLVQRIIGMSNDLPVPTVEAVVSRPVNDATVQSSVGGDT